MEPTEAAITASKAVVIMDHIKNNRIEYLLLAGLAHLLGWLNEFQRVAAGVCA
jgi:hypothetical protein